MYTTFNIVKCRILWKEVITIKLIKNTDFNKSAPTKFTCRDCKYYQMIISKYHTYVEYAQQTQQSIVPYDIKEFRYHCAYTCLKQKDKNLPMKPPYKADIAIMNEENILNFNNAMAENQSLKEKSQQKLENFKNSGGNGKTSKFSKIDKSVIETLHDCGKTYKEIALLYNKSVRQVEIKNYK